MPRPCAVETHARSYKVHAILCRCHGLAPWRLTLAATKSTQFSADATALRRGDSRSQLQSPRNSLQMPRPCAVETHARSYKVHAILCRCHGLAPWRLTLAATTGPDNSLQMPRPCAVETHARSYNGPRQFSEDATAQGRGIRKTF